MGVAYYKMAFATFLYTIGMLVHVYLQLNKIFVFYMLYATFSFPITISIIYKAEKLSKYSFLQTIKIKGLHIE